MKDSATRRAGRTAIDFIGGGGLMLLVSAIASGLNAYQAAIVVAAGTVITSYFRNLAEDKGVISPVLGTKEEN